MPNADITRSAAIGWIALVGLSIMAAQQGTQMHHKIKSHPEQFQAVLDGEKKHEVRKFDRDYQQGHLITLQEWNPNTEEYTGREVQVIIYNITWPGTFGLPNDIGCFTIAVIR